MAADDEPIKILFVGDADTGKTSLIFTAGGQPFPDEYIPTVFDNFTFAMTVNDKQYNIGAWDTAGQSQYDRLRPLSYPQTDIFVMCFNVQSRASLESIETKWIPEIEHHLPGLPIFIVGCKDDLNAADEDWPEKKLLIHGYTKNITKRIKQNIIPSDLLDLIGIYLGSLKIHFDAEQLCNSYKNVYGYMICSAKEDRGLKEIFKHIVIFHTTPKGQRIKMQGNVNNSCCIIT